MSANIRKLVVQVDETRKEMGKDITPPTRRAVAIAVIENPYAGRYSEIARRADRHRRRTRRAAGPEGRRRRWASSPARRRATARPPSSARRGELEHAAAILHPKLGAPLRVAVEKGAALVPSAKKRGTLGTAIDVPLGHKDAAFVRSHFDAIEARVSDAPRANEIVVAVAVTDSGRPLPRIGGLQASRNQGRRRSALTLSPLIGLITVFSFLFDLSRSFPMNPLRHVFSAAAVAALATALVPAHAQGVIKIGEVNSYKAQPAFLEPYKKGMELAVEEINATGGVNGKKIELITRDDNANPGDAVRVAEELVAREKIDVLTGTFLSNTGLAVADFAKQKKFFFLAGEPLTDKMTWQGGNDYTFRLRPGTYMQAAMLVPEAVKLKKKRWAVVYPNYEYGQSAVAAFKTLLKAAQPDVEFVAEQAPPLGKVDAGSRGAGAGRCQARRDLQRAVRCRPLEVRARRQHARPVQGPRGGERADRRARVPGPAEGRSAQRLDRDRLPVVRHPDARAQGLLPGLPGQVQGLPAPGLGGRLQHDQVGRGGHREGQEHRHRRSWSRPSRACRSTRRSARSPTAPKTTSPPWAPSWASTKNDNGKGVMVDYTYFDGAKFQPCAADVKKSRAAD